MQDQPQHAVSLASIIRDPDVNNMINFFRHGPPLPPPSALSNYLSYTLPRSGKAGEHDSDMSFSASKAALPPRFPPGGQTLLLHYVESSATARTRSTDTVGAAAIFFTPNSPFKVSLTANTSILHISSSTYVDL